MFVRLLRRLVPWLAAVNFAAAAQPSAAPPPRLQAVSLDCPVTIDGRADEPCWNGVPVHTVDHELRPHPGTAPRVATRYRIAQDAEALYVLVECDDPAPEDLRYVWSRRDRIGSDQDYVALYLDPIGKRTFAQAFRVNPVGSINDGTWTESVFSESIDQDFEFTVAAHIHDRGWNAEFRIPFRSLRHGVGQGADDWTVLVARNYPREDRYTYTSAPLSANSDCFLCRNPSLAGLVAPPSVRHASVQAYVLARDDRQSAPGVDEHAATARTGLDGKLRLSEATTLDLTLNPDYSLVELDTPQLSANARFGIFFSEKRPFFLEGADLLEQPLRLVYTRTIASPRAGLRATDRDDRFQALGIAAQDRGGAAIMYPGAWSSYPIVRPARANVLLGLTRLNVGPSAHLGTLLSVRDSDDGERNAVVGADGAWQVDDRHRVRAQLAASDTRQDARRIAEGDPQPSPGVGGAFLFDHSFWGEHFDSLLTLERIGSRFRSENGFVRQAGQLRAAADLGWRFGRQGWFSEVKPYLSLEENRAWAEGLVSRTVHPALQLLGPSTGILAEAHFDEARVDRGRELHPLRQVLLSVRTVPGPVVTLLQLDVEPGTRLDYANDVTGRGLRVLAEGRLRLGRRTELALRANREQIDHGDDGRILTETNAQLVIGHSVSASSWIRLIVQRFESDRLQLDLARTRWRDRRTVGSLVWAFEPLPDLSVSLGLSGDRATGDGGSATTRELFVKAAWTFGRTF